LVTLRAAKRKRFHKGDRKGPKKMIRHQLRTYTIFTISAFCLVLSIISLYFAITDADGALIYLIFGILVLGISFAIYKQIKWALRLSAGGCLLLAIVLPVGVFSLFSVGDYMAAGQEVPTVTKTLFWLIPIEALLLGIALLIDPKKESHNENL
jgi:hypothetical protein